MGDQKIYASNAGVPQPGLLPVFVSLQNVSDGSDFLPLPVISEIDDGGNANGGYKFPQPAASGDLFGVVDLDPGAVIGLVNADRYVPVFITPDDFGLTDLLDVELGSRTLDPDNNTLTYKRRDGVTTLVIFDVTKPVDLNKLIGPFIDRTPQ